MYWRTLTSFEINALDRSIPVFFPLAAVEQHGPHLTVETDTRIAEGFCAEMEKRLSENLLILPPFAVGCSSHHLDLGGTLSLTHEAWLASVEAIAASVLDQGFQTLVFFNCHGGNQAIGQVALEKLGRRYPGKQIVMLTWWKLAAETLAGLSETGPGGVGHACEFETSLMLRLAPESVRQGLIPGKGNCPTFPWAEGDMLRGAEGSLYRDMQAMTTDGNYGEPEQSSPEKGEQIIDTVATRLEIILRDLAKPALIK